MNLFLKPIQIRPYLRSLIFVGALLLSLAFLLNQQAVINKPVAQEIYLGKVSPEEKELRFAIQSDNEAYKFRHCHLEIRLCQMINDSKTGNMFSLVTEAHRVQVPYDGIIYNHSHKDGKGEFVYRLDTKIQEEINQHLIFGDKIRLSICDDAPPAKFTLWFLVPRREAKSKPIVELRTGDLE